MENNEKIWERVCEIRRWLHAYPELSMEEYETADYLEGILKELGVPTERISGLGLVATLKLGEGPVIGLRAEMDALPVQEETKLEFQSRKAGVMHACGHDAIVATAMGVILYLLDHKEQFTGTYRFLFEPGEEVGQGADLLIKGGALENPPLDALLIFHFANDQEEGMEIQRKVSTAAVGGITIQIKGSACHFSERQKGVDAVFAAGEAIRRIEKLQNSFDAGMPFVLGFGKIQGGRKSNIMADEVTLQGSLRTFEDESFERLYEALEKEMQRAGEVTGARISVTLNRRIPAFRNAPELVEKGMRAARRIYGEKAVLGEHPFLVGDNAALYLSCTPGIRMVFFAGKKGEEHFPIHHSKFDLEEKEMKKAGEMLIEFLKEWNV